MSSKYIYLIFSKTGTWLSKTINIVTEVKYAHSSISFDDSFKEMYSFGRLNPSNPFSGGLVKESLFDGVYKKSTKSECLIYKVMVTEEQYKSLKDELERFLLEKDKYRYNFIGLFGVLLNKPLQRKYHYFCSQFVSELLLKSSIIKLNKCPALTQSTDLFSVNNKELYYEGYVNKYDSFDSSYTAG